MFIVIEGTDGCGKQTQTALLKEHYKNQGKSVVSQSFPNYGSPSSAPVKMYLGGELCEKATDMDAYQTSVLFSVDRLCTMQKLKKQNADVWVFDRYVESNMIHQGGKIKDKEELYNYVDWLQNLEYNELKLPRPTTTIFLNMPPKNSIELAHARTSQKSGEKKDIHEQDENHLVSAWRTGLEIANRLGWKVIDCVDDNSNLLTIEEIHNKILNAIEDEKTK